MRGITPTQFHEADGVEDWRMVGEGVCAYFRTGSFAAGVEFLRGISELADLDPQHPDVDVRHGGVLVRLITYAPGSYGLSERDIELAQQISAVAREQGLSPDPSLVQTVQVTVDALIGAEVIPFWRALLGYQDRGDSPEDLIDPPPDAVERQPRRSSLWLLSPALAGYGPSAVYHRCIIECDAMMLACAQPSLSIRTWRRS